MINNKKGAVDLTELAVGIVILGIVVSIGATILITMRNSQITNAGTYQVANETITPATTGTNLATTWVKSINTVTNATGGQVINSGNFTTSINSGTGVGTVSNLSSAWPGNWNISYTVYNTSDARYTIPNTAATGLAEYGNWFKILVIVGIAAVILALIFMAFGNRGGVDGGGQSY